MCIVKNTPLILPTSGKRFGFGIGRTLRLCQWQFQKVVS